jgi:D-proline reductase (dithiol) PrdB
VAGDDVHRGEAAAAQPVPIFEETPFTEPPPLGDARVAIVTTAALRHEDDRAFGLEDESFRILRSADRLELDHSSPNFDRTGWLADLNVVVPVDRLHELAAAGTIGSVSAVHLAFQGAQRETLATIRLDSGPAAAQLLRQEGVDVVVLTGV